LSPSQCRPAQARSKNVRVRLRTKGTKTISCTGTDTTLKTPLGGVPLPVHLAEFLQESHQRQLEARRRRGRHKVGPLEFATNPSVFAVVAVVVVIVWERFKTRPSLLNEVLERQKKNNKTAKKEVAVVVAVVAVAFALRDVWASNTHTHAQARTQARTHTNTHAHTHTHTHLHALIVERHQAEQSRRHLAVESVRLYAGHSTARTFSTHLSPPLPRAWQTLPTGRR
jgi:hypothetical protein